MKIITILLLMISTQALAEERVIVDKAQARFSPRMERLKQCDQIANISKRTIKAAIIGVPIAEVINKFADRPDRLAILEDVQAKFGTLERTDHNDITGDTSNLAPSPGSHPAFRTGDNAQISGNVVFRGSEADACRDSRNMN